MSATNTDPDITSGETSEVAQNPPEVVSITADTATLSNNNFSNHKTSLDSSVTVTANRITYRSNRSVCDKNQVPTANVFLLGPTVIGQITGSITAVSNTCLEPLTAPIADIEGALQEFRTQQATLVSKFMATQVQAERQQLLQQPGALSNQEQEFALRLKEILAPGGSSSLFVSAAFAVTGMNLLSHSLVLLGIGSDQGSVEGVPFP